MKNAGTKSLKLYSEEEYNLNNEQRAELRRIVARIVGRRLTGELVVNLAEGGVNTVKVREVVKRT